MKAASVHRDDFISDNMFVLMRTFGSADNNVF